MTSPPLNTLVMPPAVAALPGPAYTAATGRPRKPPARLTIWSARENRRPFIVPVVWGIIIAVAVYPGYRRLEAVLGGHRTIAATLFTLLMLILLIGPL